jgi:ribosomal biogenesis protein LAS1
MLQLLTRNCRIEMNMIAASLIWDGLLQTITTSKPKFYSSLINRLLEELIKPSATDPNFDKDKSALFQWLVHLLCSREWEAICDFQDDLKTHVTETSLLSPTVWTHKLAKAIIDRADEGFRELWAPLYEASIFGGAIEVAGLPGDLTVHDKAMQDKETHAVADEETDDERGGAGISLSSTISLVDVGVSGPTATLTNISTDRGWRLWEGGWVPKPIGV